MATHAGISHLAITDVPIAVFDFETTGLTPGVDRVVEVSVVRIDPGKKPRLVLDTLVNPMRRMGASEIHGITDADVVNAPRFSDLAGDLMEAIHGCVLAAYNVYFDIKFLNFELQNTGVFHDPPHFCLMYLRPMLGLGDRCKLEDACRVQGIELTGCHVAAHDALASGELFRRYQEIALNKGIRTFGDLAKLKKYKFNDSFSNDPFPHPTSFNLKPNGNLCSRSAGVQPVQTTPLQHPIAAYFDTLKTVVADLDISDQELTYVAQERQRLGLTLGQVRSIHAKAFASVLSRFADDWYVDNLEVLKLQRLHQCLSKLGWAPGE